MKKCKYIGETINGFEIIGTQKIKTHTYYIAKCKKCGAELQRRGDTVISGQAKCICQYKVELHGLTNTSIYDAWGAMKNRCMNADNEEYTNYGGRGIKVCSAWNESFLSFFEWSISNGYHEGLTIDRIDNDGNYEPSNCRWTTMKVQCNNRRNNRLETYNGKTQTLKQWADEYHINYSTLKSRMNISHWSIEKALTTQIRGYKNAS